LAHCSTVNREGSEEQLPKPSSSLAAANTLSGVESESGGEREREREREVERERGREREVERERLRERG